MRNTNKKAANSSETEKYSYPLDTALYEVDAYPYLVFYRGLNSIIAVNRVATQKIQTNFLGTNTAGQKKTFSVLLSLHSLTVQIKAQCL